MTSAPWITATGQQWKLLVLYILVAIMLCMVLGILAPSMGRLVTHDRELFLVFSGSAVSWASAGWRWQCDALNVRSEPGGGTFKTLA